MIQQQFVDRVVAQLRSDARVTGLAVGGSWIAKQMDKFSDVDLILVTADKVAGDKEQMLAYANSFGKLLAGFTGEHVGEPRVLICLYDDPLLHVDIKFLTLPEFHTRVEDPVILLDKDDQLAGVINTTTAVWPYPDYQWLEDRFWVWVHYGATKLGRGEYFETLDFVAFLRARVLAPLMQVKSGLQSKALRKVEKELRREDLDDLIATVTDYDPASINDALLHCIRVYKALRQQLYPADIVLQKVAEEKSTAYLQQISARIQ